MPEIDGINLTVADELPVFVSAYHRIGNMAPSNPPTTKGISSEQGKRLEPASGSSWVRGSGVGDAETLI